MVIYGNYHHGPNSANGINGANNRSLGKSTLTALLLLLKILTAAVCERHDDIVVYSALNLKKIYYT